MYVFCRFSLTVRNISVHVSKNIWKKVGILVFKLTLSHSVSGISRPWKCSAHLEITWKSPGILLWAKGKNPVYPIPSIHSLNSVNPYSLQYFNFLPSPPSISSFSSFYLTVYCLCYQFRSWSKRLLDWSYWKATKRQDNCKFGQKNNLKITFWSIMIVNVSVWQQE